jgi:nucleotide-binding universal stress UspA family protein
MIPFKTILFATDFSPTSQKAFEVAAALAQDYKARIIVIHVLEPVTMGFSEFGAYVGPEEDRAQALELLQATKPASPSITTEYRLLDGDPATVILETAQETNADLIVMGTHGRAGLTRFVMGSVAESVLRRSPCPVMTIRGVIAERSMEPAEMAETITI